MGFVKEIRQNSVDSQQASPAYVLTFVRWSNRDTFNYTSGAPDSLDTRNPFVVVNDAIKVTTTDKKSSMTSTATIALKGGDINYATAVHPGDFVLVNMLNWPKDAMRVRGKALKRQPINKVGDGFKGLYKIQNVVENLSQNPDTGAKNLTYTITAASFTEFNNTIYYNPALAAAFSDKGTNLFQSLIGQYYQDNLKTNSEVQVIVKDLFKILIGKSLKDKDPKIRNFGNTHFKVPTLLGKLIGRDDAKFANEIYNYILGIWKDSRDISPSEQNLGLGFNPGIKQDSEGNFYSTGTLLQGNKEVFIENWNNSTAWSIIKQNTNSVMNELFTSHRISPDNYVLPTVIVRQKPFTTNHFESRTDGNGKPDGYAVTKFLQLPRWKISPNLLLSKQTSKNEAARFNFVQVYTRSLSDVADQDMAQQIALKNFVEDARDIQRNGLRPYVVTANFDFPTKDRNKRIRAREWARILSDWIIGGHLKESGTFVFQGIQDPIAVGDNIEFDNIVYHIESITHDISIMPSGKKKFRTTLQVTYGMDKRSSKDGPIYANMEHTDAYTRRIDDWQYERVLPGIGDTQDLPSREMGEEVVETEQASFTPQSVSKKRQKSEESNTGEDKNHQIDDAGRSTRKK